MKIAALPAKEGFTFGCDPEGFVVNEDGVAVFPEFIPGTKEAPFPVKFGAVQRDGMAAEFNIDPARTFEEFNRNISAVIGQMEKMLPKGHRLQWSPTMTFSPEVWEKTPAEAKELGCTPDFDAWTGEVNPPPDTTDYETLRTASGHLHIGWTEDGDVGDIQHLLSCRDLVKQLDWYLGGWSLTADPDPIRRALYGKAGACRYKPYGVEYRVLSNFWVAEPKTRLEVWNRVMTAIDDMRSGFIPDSAGSWNKSLVESINTSVRNPDLDRTFSYPLTSMDRFGASRLRIKRAYGRQMKVIQADGTILELEG